MPPSELPRGGPLTTLLAVNRTGAEVRVALVEGGRTVALQVERERERSIVGNVYRGRVVRIVPGMQAAFVDIGLEKAAFLYVGDVAEATPEQVGPEPQPDPETTDLLQRPPPEPEAPPSLENTVATWLKELQGRAPLDPLAATVADDRLVEMPEPGPSRRRIEDVLKVGQELTLQVTKDPLGTKGPRVSTELAIPGRFLVYLVGAQHVGVSRRIEAAAERDRLRRVVTALRQPGEGFIVRTVCAGRDEDVLAEDVTYLRQRWHGIQAALGRGRVPSLVHAELDVVLRATRDLLTHAVDRIVLDDPQDYRRVSDFVARFLPTFRDRVEQHVAADPIFEHYGVEKAVQRALSRTVRLPSGGYIVIEKTEALTSVDVNSGRYVSGRSPQEATLKINLEAAEAVAEQVRLRDIGGLIVIDFIDMDTAEHRGLLHEALLAHFAGDPARPQVLPVSEFGLVQMTRRRVKEALAQSLLDTCPACDGRGQLKSVETMAYEVLRELRRQVTLAPIGRSITVRCEAGVARFLQTEERDCVQDLQSRLGGAVQVLADAGFDRHRFDVAFDGAAEAG